MTEKNGHKERFSESKRDFLKQMALMAIYTGPLIRSFEMAEISGKPTGPIKKKEPPEPPESTQGEVRARSAPHKSRFA